MANDPSTSDKDTLLKASKLMGVECSSHSLHNFKEFYSIGVEESASAASVLVSSALDQSMNNSGEADKDSSM